MRAARRKAREQQACCLDENGAKRPFHLCCRACRAEMEEQERARLMAMATAPERCSDRIPLAPARGRVAEFRESRTMPDVASADGYKVVEEAYRNGAPGRCRDVFDVMTDYATRRGGTAPFTIGQVEAGRAYRDLHQRVAAAGVKGSAAFSTETRGKGKVDFMDAYIADLDVLQAFHRAIGRGIAKEVRRGSPVPEGKVRIGDEELARIGRKLITVRELVDAVCLAEKPLGAVLKAHGWRVSGKNQKPLLAALRAAMERMREV